MNCTSQALRMHRLWVQIHCSTLLSSSGNCRIRHLVNLPLFQYFPGEFATFWLFSVSSWSRHVLQEGGTLAHIISGKHSIFSPWHFKIVPRFQEIFMILLLFQCRLGWRIRQYWLIRHFRRVCTWLIRQYFKVANSAVSRTVRKVSLICSPGRHKQCEGIWVVSLGCWRNTRLSYSQTTISRKAFVRLLLQCVNLMSSNTYGRLGNICYSPW